MLDELDEKKIRANDNRTSKPAAVRSGSPPNIPVMCPGARSKECIKPMLRKNIGSKIARCGFYTSSLSGEMASVIELQYRRNADTYPSLAGQKHLRIS